MDEIVDYGESSKLMTSIFDLKINHYKPWPFYYTYWHQVFTIQLDKDKSTLERKVYTFLDLVTEVGGLMRLEAKEEALQFFPLSIILRSPALRKPLLTGETKRRQTVRGFTLNWFLEDDNGTRLTEMLPAREKDWEPRSPNS